MALRALRPNRRCNCWPTRSAGRALGLRSPRRAGRGGARRPGRAVRRGDELAPGATPRLAFAAIGSWATRSCSASHVRAVPRALRRGARGGRRALHAAEIDASTADRAARRSELPCGEKARRVTGVARERGLDGAELQGGGRTATRRGTWRCSRSPTLIPSGGQAVRLSLRDRVDQEWRYDAFRLLRRELAQISGPDRRRAGSRVGPARDDARRRCDPRRSPGDRPPARARALRPGRDRRAPSSAPRPRWQTSTPTPTTCLVAVARRDWEKARRVPADLRAPSWTKLSSDAVEAWTVARRMTISGFRLRGSTGRSS